MFFLENNKLFDLMKFSILITSYNKGEYIEKTINSCLNQTEVNFEVILCDNFSTDQTDLIIQKYSKNISIIRKKRISKYAPLNQTDLLISAFQKSSGDIICLLDGDDFFYENKLAEVKRIFLENEDIDLVFDIPIIKKGNIEKKLILKKKSSKYIWPTIIPTSCISLKRDFMKECISNYLVDEFKHLEVDLKLNIISQNIKKNFKFSDKRITIYQNVKNSIMANNKKFCSNWWAKRTEAHAYIKKVYLKNNLKYKKGIDAHLTAIVNKILNK